MVKLFARASKHEKWVFLSVTILNLFPIFLGKFFPTLDGPSHLYNSNLIVNLLFNSEGLSSFYALNPELVPNWSGHFILSVFKSVLPAFLAEKILLLTYFIGLPYAFRSLVTQVNAKNILASYLIFPFLYSYPFMLGFYNFSLALGFMLLALSYWLKHQEDIYSSNKAKMVMFVLFMLTYFSHLIVFAVLLLILGIYVVFDFIQKFTIDNTDAKSLFKNAGKKTLALLITSALPFILFSNYFMKRSSTGSEIYIEPSILIKALFDLRPLIVYNMSFEKQYTQIIFFVLLFLALAVLVKKVLYFFKKQKVIKENSETNSGHLRWVWLLSALVMLVLYFTLPDANGSGSFISVRFALLFFLCFLIWLASHNFPIWLMRISVLVVLVCNGILISNYIKTIREQSKIALDCNSASESIKDKSVILPLKYGGPSVGLHFSNYLGVDKPLVILKNYECVTGYFPVIWNQEVLPNSVHRNLVPGYTICERMLHLIKDENVTIDFVFVFGALNLKTGACYDQLNTEVLTNYHLVYSSSNCELYERN